MNNCGVYTMYFKEIDNKYYIGCSSRIATREKEHRTELKYNNHSNYKLQEAYNLYNEIEFDILEYCNIEKMYEREEYWIRQFNSFNDGFNLTNGGVGIGYGIGNPNTKYSEEVYKNILYEIAYTDKTAKEIAVTLNVSIGVVKPIIRQSAHNWLKNVCPIEYEIVSNKQKLIKLNRQKLVPKLISPDGSILEITTNARQFALENNLDPSRLSKLLNGKIDSYRGFKTQYESNY